MTQKKPGRMVRRDVLRSIAVALGIASLFSAYVLLLYAFKGNEPFEDLETTPAVIVFVYFSAAILVGTLIGLLLPLARAGRLGAGLLGILAGAAFGSMVVFAEHGFSWGTANVVAVLSYALLVGLPVGMICRRTFGEGF